MWTREKLLHPATAIALVALFVSLGGVTYAAATIGTRQLKNGAVTNAKLRNGAVSGAKIRKDAISTTRIARGAVRGDRIAREGVTAREIQEGAITSGKLADGAITPGKLAVNAVTGTKLADGGVTAGKLADGSVATAKLADGSVATAKLADGSVATAKLGEGAVSAAKLGDGAVATAKLADGAVTAAKLAPGAAVAGSGRMAQARVELPSGAPATPLLDLPGIGTLRANCTGGIASTSLLNTGTTIVTAQATWQDGNARTGVTRFGLGTRSAGGITNFGSSGVQSITWQASSVDAAGVTHVATAWVSLGATGTGCLVIAQGLVS